MIYFWYIHIATAHSLCTIIIHGELTKVTWQFNFGGGSGTEFTKCKYAPKMYIPTVSENTPVRERMTMQLKKRKLLTLTIRKEKGPKFRPLVEITAYLNH